MVRVWCVCVCGFAGGLPHRQPNAMARSLSAFVSGFGCHLDSHVPVSASAVGVFSSLWEGGAAGRTHTGGTVRRAAIAWGGGVMVGFTRSRAPSASSGGGFRGNREYSSCGVVYSYRYNPCRRVALFGRACLARPPRAKE